METSILVSTVSAWKAPTMMGKKELTDYLDALKRSISSAPPVY
jgi:hypothetical protein